MKNLTLEQRIAKLEKILNKRLLEHRIAKLESALSGKICWRS